MLYYSRKYYWKNPSNREKKSNFSTNYYTNVEYTERIIANKMQINDVNKFEWNNFILFFLSYMLIWAPVGISCRFIICVWRIHLRAENGIYVIENIVEHWLFWLVVLFSHDGWRTWFSLIFKFQRNALNTHTHTNRNNAARVRILHTKYHFEWLLFCTFLRPFSMVFMCLRVAAVLSRYSTMNYWNN